MDEMEVENKKRELKHLGFVRIAAIKALVWVSNLYDFAKQNSGPLKSTVGTVEGAVTTVVGPVCQKLKGVPDDLLAFLDNKVDDAAGKFDKHAPPVAKQVASQTQWVILKVSEKAQELVNQFQAGGPRAAMHYTAEESKHFVLYQSVKVWAKLSKYPSLQTAADLTVPTAVHWTEKYNHAVKGMSEKGYTIFGYAPLVPIDDIATAFKEGDAGKKEATQNKPDSD